MEPAVDEAEQQARREGPPQVRPSLPVEDLKTKASYR
jgi:hypothetical protein